VRDGLIKRKFYASIVMNQIRPDLKTNRFLKGNNFACHSDPVRFIDRGID